MGPAPTDLPKHLVLPNLAELDLGLLVRKLVQPSSCDTRKRRRDAARALLVVLGLRGVLLILRGSPFKGEEPWRRHGSSPRNIHVAAAVSPRLVGGMSARKYAARRLQVRSFTSL